MKAWGALPVSPVAHPVPVAVPIAVPVRLARPARRRGQALHRGRWRRALPRHQHKLHTAARRTTVGALARMLQRASPAVGQQARPLNLLK